MLIKFDTLVVGLVYFIQVGAMTLLLASPFQAIRLFSIQSFCHNMCLNVQSLALTHANSQSLLSRILR
ncbi:hypothetical protein JCM19239_3261 [Vibrio variabilis]|uniref:Uncharacterized protein n=1 Tax=Vibrio variabilis TaxID=990271 RepID=A0ABQ0JFX0_9VIBR|nr:hypothetical protein JCM19239_3261 [Vibrio variabilis]